VAGQPLEGLQKPRERAKRAAGLSADLRIHDGRHDVRHGLAPVLANAGTPLHEIGALLGHRRLSATT
jgi:site-specific recombinase XerD